MICPICFQELRLYKGVPDSKVCINHDIWFSFKSKNKYRLIKGDTLTIEYEVDKGSIIINNGTIPAEVLNNLDKILKQKAFI